LDSSQGIFTKLVEAAALILQGRLTARNKGAQPMYGYSAAEATKQSARMLIPAGRADEEVKIREAIDRGAGTAPCETVRRRKDGSLVEFERETGVASG
jgi:PAS domain S-box-containing protein